MNLEFEKVVSDRRGSILFLKFGQKNINLVQIKKGFARGGHYHSFESSHYVLSGIIEYKEKNIETEDESITTIKGPATIFVPPMRAHLLIALEDTLFFEAFDTNYSATDYGQYRQIVLQKIS